jgi:hypothetical protein
VSLPIPLSVQLSNSRTTKHIERELRSLSFRSVAPGGFASAQFSLDRPLSKVADELAYYTDVDIYDMRNRECVWCGRLEDPGRGVGADGQVWDLAAVGPSAHAQDRSFSYVMIHTNVGDWRKATYSTEDMVSATATISPEIGGDQSLGVWCNLPTSSALPANARAAALLNSFFEAGHELAVLSYKWDAHGSASGLSADFRVKCTTEDGTVVRNDPLNAIGGAASTRSVGTNWTLGQKGLRLMVRWEGGATSTGNADILWAFFDDVIVASVRYNKDGTKKTSGYGVADQLLYADQVVSDLLGRYLSEFDGANAVVETDTFGMNQFAYQHGTTAAQILADLMMVEPTKYWAAWERNAAGKHRFEWRAWPTDVAYETGAQDGYSSTGSGEGLFNRVAVTWERQDGLIITTIRTQTVPELDSVGLVRTGHVDLGRELNSQLMAERIGDQWLADHRVPSNAGQLTVARPIYDRSLGRLVAPWEIRPGKLIRVRGIQPSSDALNASSPDGVTVFKVVGVSYDTSSASATLELDSQPNTLAHMLARLQNAPTRSTRRIPARR